MKRTKIDVSKPILFPDGKEFLRKVEEEKIPFTLRDCLMASLLTPEDGLNADDCCRRYELADRIQKQDKVLFTLPDALLITGLVGKDHKNPAIVGFVMKLFFDKD